MTHIPTGLPTLSPGPHSKDEGQACFMEYVSLLAGEAWSDRPACTHPVIAALARTINDRMPDSERHLLAPLIPSVIGTADLRDDHAARSVLSVRLAVWLAWQVLPLTGAAYEPARAAIEAAEAWCGCPCASHAAAAVGAYAAHAAAEVRAFCLTGAVRSAASAAAYAAHAAAVGANAANAAAVGANAANAVAINAINKASVVGGALRDLLAGLIDCHAELTGHTTDPQIERAWAEADWRALIHA